jgi:hypothetical protein
MQECIIYVRDKAFYSFLENIMQLTRKGFNHENHNSELSLKKRLTYSQKLAEWINSEVTEERDDLMQLRKDMDAYFTLEKRMKIQDRFVHAAQHGQSISRTKELILLLTMWPLALVGWFHGLIPYILAKKITEKIMRRKVFWGSVKMMLGKLLGSIYNIPIVMALTHYLLPHWSLGVVYFLFIAPTLWRIAYAYQNWYLEFRLKGKMKQADLSKFVEKRKQLVEKIDALIPVA